MGTCERRGDSREHICLRSLRSNEVFWDELEVRMRTDTSGPRNIYLVRELEDDFLDRIVNMLDSWK